MKKVCLSILLLTVFIISSNAQDEGVLTKKERLTKSNGIYVTGGPSWTFGDNIGDYKNGLNFELGYAKRVNRALSFGGSIGYMKFKYDPSVTAENAAYTEGYGDPNGWGATYGLPDFVYEYGYYLELEGGDINMTTVAANIKVNFIPVMDESRFSFYAFAKPFVAFSTRDAVSGTGTRFAHHYYEDLGYLYYDDSDTWYPDGVVAEWGPEDYPALKKENEVTGGIYLGPGFEYNPGKAFSIFAQASIGYTFPITYVSTGAYGQTVDDYANEKFPMVKEGFTSIAVQLGFSYNF